MVSKFIIAAYMSILDTDNVHICTNKFENLDKCDLYKTRYFDDIFTFIENEYILMPRKIECIEVNDQIDEYLKQTDRMNQKVVGI